MELFIVSDPAQIAGIEEKIKANKAVIDAALSSLDKLADQPDEKEILARIRQARSDYVASFSKVIGLINAGNKDEAVTLMNAETLHNLDALQSPIFAMADLQKKHVSDASATVLQNTHFATQVMFILGALATLASIVAALLITRSIVRPLAEAVEIAQTVARGDLTHSIHNDYQGLFGILKQDIIARCRL